MQVSFKYNALIRSHFPSWGVRGLHMIKLMVTIVLGVLLAVAPAGVYADDPLASQDEVVESDVTSSLPDDVTTQEAADTTVPENAASSVDAAANEETVLPAGDEAEDDGVAVKAPAQADAVEPDEEAQETMEAEVQTLDLDTQSASARYEVPAVSYSAHVAEIGWQESVTEGETAGTTGRSLAVEALRVRLSDITQGGIRYTAHVAEIGWLDYWAQNGAEAGTTDRGLPVQALKIELTGNLANLYDVYYRVHVSNIGWMTWARNGEPAGTTGWGYAVEAFEIRLVEKGGPVPAGDAAVTVPSLSAELSVQQVGESTQLAFGTEEAQRVLDVGLATDARLSLAMSYGGSVTRHIEQTVPLSTIAAGGYAMDAGTYGPFTLSISYLKSGRTVRTSAQPVGVSASTYNVAPLSATFPVVLFSLSYWDIATDANGTAIPTVVMLDRPSAYDWNSLPDGMYALPYLSNPATSNYQAFADYVGDLYELNPDAHFNLYINDITCSLIHQIIYANGIPAGAYSITMLSDGSATYEFTNEAFAVENPSAHQAELVGLWNEAKAYAYRTGKVSSDYGFHMHWDSMYAVLACEPGTEWWMTRTNLFTSGDNNAFANGIASDPHVVQKNVANMLAALQSRGDDVVSAFKRLYNFNDGYFSDAEEQGKKVMVLLGTYVSSEAHFEDYAKLTMAYYGNDYAYFYKGHPNTPTALWPSKQEELDKLGITDVDSSVAAELILFFNPEISLSGYGSSTFNSASAEMAGGLYGARKEEALDPGGSIDYSIMDWFASPITEGTDAAIRVLCAPGDTCYLIEFSDEVLQGKPYDFGIYSHDDDVIRYYKKQLDGSYRLVQVGDGTAGVRTEAHVAEKGWMPAVSSGDTAGTVGENLPMEAFKLSLQNVPCAGSISYRAHVADIGWQDWMGGGEAAGTTGKALQIEAVQIRLDGDVADRYDVYYRAHVADYGWLPWTLNGKIAGTQGYRKSLQALEIILVEKGGKAPGETGEAFIHTIVNSAAHVQDIGWQEAVNEGATVGTTGLAKALEAVRISLVGSPYRGGIKVRAHSAQIGWGAWAEDGELAGTTGRGLQLEAVEIELTGEMEDHFDVVYRAHVADKGWLEWVCNGELAGTTGEARRVEAIQIKLVEKA